MIDRIMEMFISILKKPRLIVISGIIITVVFAMLMPLVEFDNDPINFLAKDNIRRVVFDKYKHVFTGSNVIYVGVESKDAYSYKSVAYVGNLTKKIEALNRTFPVKQVAGLLRIDLKEAGRLIQAINEKELLGRDELKKIFSDKGAMVDEFFWEEQFAEKISGRIAEISFDELMENYRIPVDDIMSVSDVDYIYGEGDRFTVGKLLDEITPESVNGLKQRSGSWDIYDNFLFSDDGTLTSIGIKLHDIDADVRQALTLEIADIVNKNVPEGFNTFMAGESVIADTLNNNMAKDLIFLLPFVVLLMVITLYFIFRNYEGVLYPLLAIFVSVVMSIGTIVVLGFQMNLITNSMPVVLTAVASAYGIHLMTHYFMSRDSDRLKSVIYSLKHSGTAIIIAGLTTVAGFASLATSQVTHVRNFGIITSFGVFYALVIAMVLIPGFLLLSKKEKIKPGFSDSENGGDDFAGRFLKLIEKSVHAKPFLIVLLFITVVSVCVYGITKLEVNMDDISMFRKSAQIRISDSILNEKLSGTQRLSLIVENIKGKPVVTPEVLGKVENFQRDVRAKFPETGKTLSINNFLKKMNQEMYAGDKNRYRLPETAQKISDYLLLYSGDLGDILTSQHDKIKVSVNIKRTRTKKIEEIMKYMEDYFGVDFKKKHHVQTYVTGGAGLIVELNNLMVSGQLKSLVTSFLLVSILIFVIFRSIKFTLIGLIPLVLGVTMNFGAMGFLGIDLNAGTALVAAVAIGIGIDYSVHFISQYQNNRKRSGSVEAALQNTFQSTGRAILANVLTVAAGFMVLMFSEFITIMEFGALTALTVTATGIGAIIMIPVFIKIFDHPAEPQ